MSRSGSKDKEKTEYYNNLVYSGFQHIKGSATFYKQEKFKDSESSPGPGAYDAELTVRDLSNSKRSSLGPTTFYKAKKNSFIDDNKSPGVGAYNLNYHMLS